MKIKSLLLMMICAFSFNLLSAQTVELYVNADKVDHNHLYAFYPEQLRFSIFNGDVKYTLAKGAITVSVAGKTVEKISVDNSMIDGKLINHDNLKGAKVSILIEEISEENSKQRHKLDRTYVVNFAKDLEVKPNSNFAILLNNSANHTKFGIDPASVKNAEVRTNDKLKDKPLIIYHIVGAKASRQMEFANAAELEKALPAFLQDKTIANGHKILVEFKDSPSLPKFEIKIKK
jgi:hypothetical protein